MGKLKNLTQAELAEMLDRAEALMDDMHEALKKFPGMYVDDLLKPRDAAQSFTCLARSAADISVRLVAYAKLQEQKAELKKLRAAV